MADSANVKLGPGTLYVAKLGTTEPVAVTGAWPSGWQELGYTDAGSQFDYAIASDPVEVEEELFPIGYEPTGATGSMTFALAEQTAENLLIALNAGVASDRAADTTGDLTGGGKWVEPPALEVIKRVMVGWDALDANQNGDAFGRIVARQCLQTGSLSIVRRKGANKSTYSCVFSFEKPSGAQPFRAFFPDSLAS